MKKRKTAAAGILAVVLFLFQPVFLIWGKTEEPQNLYALSAVLMDGDSGRILYGKKEEVPRPNASTTKVLTCILALENAPGDDYVKVSENAVLQPEVKLHMKKGEQYYLEDLLYSLMLKSHNDTAVAIAEHIGGTQERFAKMMNKKAEEIGCKHTHFITPNGLDAKDSGGEHCTTAHDLALIMRYAIQNKTFLKITQTREYSFWNIGKKRQFHLRNTNALFDMTDGVISGKTGFTGNAGYCYVCAVEKEGKTFVVSLLGCGWPNHKGYKWEDTKKLLDYGQKNYEYRSFWIEPALPAVPVKNGVNEDGRFGKTAYVLPELTIGEQEKNRKILTGKKQNLSMKEKIAKELSAPVKRGQKIGEIVYCLDDMEILSYPVYAAKTVKKITYRWYVEQVFQSYFH